MAASALPTCVPRVDSTGDDPLVPCFVFSVREDTSFHPESPFAIASVTILPPARFELAQVLKHQDARLVLSGKLDNTSTHQVRDLLIDMGDLAPEVDIVLFALCDDTRFAPVACNPS